MIVSRIVGGVLVVSALAFTGISAQGRETTFGVLGGVTSATFTGDDAEDADSKIGMTFGGFISFGMSAKFAIETGALYSQRGAQTTAEGVTAKINLDYVEVPLLASLRFPGKGKVTPFLSAGPALAFKLGCSLSASSDDASFDTSCSNFTEQAGGQFASTDFGIVGTAGVDMNSWRLAVRYFSGLSEVYDTDPPVNSKNSVFSLVLGYRF